MKRPQYLSHPLPAAHSTLSVRRSRPRLVPSVFHRLPAASNGEHRAQPELWPSFKLQPFRSKLTLSSVGIHSTHMASRSGLLSSPVSCFIHSAVFSALSPTSDFIAGPGDAARWSNLGASSGRPSYKPRPTRQKGFGSGIVAVRSTKTSMNRDVLPAILVSQY